MHQQDIRIITCPMKYDDHIPHVSFAEFLLGKIKQHGDKVALIDAATKMTYTFAEVYSYITELAAGLQVKMNLKPKEKAAVLMPNCAEYPLLILAIQLCGGTAVLINPEQTINEIKHCVKLISPKMWITNENSISKLDEIYKSNSTEKPTLILANVQAKKGYFITVDKLRELGRNLIIVKPTGNDMNFREEAALILFSSGTTGLPKGVLLTHFNYIVARRQTEELFKIASQQMIKSGMDLSQIKQPDHCFLAYLPFCHTSGLSSLIDQLSMGTKSVILSDYTFSKFLNAIQEFKVTICVIVPPIAVRLSKEPVEKKYDLSSLIDIVSAGAVLSQKTISTLEKKLSCTINQGYGMTETGRSHGTTFFPKKENNNIGVVYPFYEAKVIDVNTSKALGPNEEGEICVRSPMVMKGYIGNEDETRKTIDQDGWLHSGDIGYYDKDGYFYITDRMKELIKYNGFQVSPVELEQIILTHPDVLDAAVGSVLHESAGELPRAYVVKRAGAKVKEEDIASFVADNVSKHKQLRGGVVFIEIIPKTGSGKIIRRQLRVIANSKL